MSLADITIANYNKKIYRLEIDCEKNNEVCLVHFHIKYHDPADYSHVYCRFYSGSLEPYGINIPAAKNPELTSAQLKEKKADIEAILHDEERVLKHIKGFFK